MKRNVTWWQWGIAVGCCVLLCWWLWRRQANAAKEIDAVAPRGANATTVLAPDEGGLDRLSPEASSSLSRKRDSR